MRRSRRETRKATVTGDLHAFTLRLPQTTKDPGEVSPPIPKFIRHGVTGVTGKLKAG